MVGGDEINGMALTCSPRSKEEKVGLLGREGERFQKVPVKSRENIGLGRKAWGSDGVIEGANSKGLVDN